MNLVGTKIKLGFDEPWDAPKTIIGHVIQQYSAVDEKNYLLIEELYSNEKYVVTNRYTGDNIANISLKGKKIVAIFKPLTETFSFENNDFTSSLSYISIGLIEIYED
jgi:hypothetical protein